MRWASTGQRGATVWLTGLPASGKSTIAVAVERALVESGRFAYLLDGDNLRHGLSGDLGFDPASRSENIRRVAHVARLFADAGAVAVVSLVSPFREDRLNARRLHEAAGLPFVEVFVDTPIEECARRDPKGLYARARAGRLTGMTGENAPYEPPEAAEIVIRDEPAEVVRAAPARGARVMEPYAVTNHRFAAFADATGYVTEAERDGWSFVFAGRLPDDHPPTRALASAPWWRAVPGASLARARRARARSRSPGPPRRARLPRRRARRSAPGPACGCRPRPQWEHAARAGVATRYPWGDELVLRARATPSAARTSRTAPAGTVPGRRLRAQRARAAQRRRQRLGVDGRAAAARRLLPLPPVLLRPQPALRPHRGRGADGPHRLPRSLRLMEKRQLGDSGVEVSTVALGSWLTYSGGIGREQTEACTRAAFDAGITLFDTANVYGHGRGGDARGARSSATTRATSYVLATKVYFPMGPRDRGLSRKQILKQIDGSLERLQTDYVDLYQCHRYDDTVPLEETMGALTEVVEAGKARHIGFSRVAGGPDPGGAATCPAWRSSSPRSRSTRRCGASPRRR